jgi:transcriptional regulator with XRE-family HTH domain
MRVVLRSRRLRSESLSARLKAIREVAGIHPTVLAQRVGVSRVTLLQWESRRCEPSLAMIEKLAEALGTAPEFLAFGPGVWLAQPLSISFAPDQVGGEGP